MNLKDKYDIISFDTGPGNVIIDELMRIISKNKLQYDKDGELASKGVINDKILNELLKLNYLKLNPPKTTGRELFSNFL